MTEYQKKEIDFLREIIHLDSKSGWKRYHRYLDYKYMCGHSTVMAICFIISGVLTYYLYTTAEWQYAMATAYGPLILIAYVALATISVIWHGNILGLHILDNITNNWKENMHYDGEDWIQPPHYFDE